MKQAMLLMLLLVCGAARAEDWVSIGTQPDEWVDYAASHVVVNCENGTYWEDSLVWYYENGDRLQVPAEQIPAQWTSINPVKIVDQEMKFICGWKPQ